MNTSPVLFSSQVAAPRCFTPPNEYSFKFMNDTELMPSKEVMLIAED
jgi:hypothetical protein